MSAKLASERVVVSAPMSYHGSASRIWTLVGLSEQAILRILLGILAVAMILVAWTLVTGWYALWGLWLVPYRLIRRGGRKRNMEGLRHREQLAAIESLKG